MPFTVPNLPYDKAALEPYMSAKTLDFHHGKHHRKYVDTLNALTMDTRYAAMDPSDLVRATAGATGKKQQQIFNNAAQAWNHAFFWHCMKPGGGGRPGGAIAKKIDENFGSYDEFRVEFVKAAKGRFGSGWAWLVTDGKKLQIVTTPNAENPLTDDKTCLLACDVWEHAYYLDYQNQRSRFVEAFLDHMVNWAWANEQWELERKAA
jgi:Fe-Mn family superoxide dismutase